MKVLTILAGIICAMPFVVFAEPFYSGYISFLLLLIVAEKRVNMDRLIYYILYCVFFVISLSNVNYNFELKSIIMALFMPFVFIVSDFRIDYNSFFKGINIGISIVVLSLVILAYKKNLLGNFILFLTSERGWGIGENIFYGNGTALIITLASSFYLINSKVVKSLIVNVLGLITTSRTVLLMFIFIFIYIIFIDRNIGRKYKVLMGIVLSVLLLYVLIFISQNDVLYERVMKSDDRGMIFEESYSLFKQNYLLGFGPKKIRLYNHLHNSFFEVLFRYGVVTFIFYILVLTKKNLKTRKLFFIFATVSILAFTQINLFNINYVILLSVIISYSKFNFHSKLTNSKIHRK